MHFFFIVGCNSSSSDSAIAIESDGNIVKSEYEKERIEYKNLKSAQFERADQFLISPIVFAKSEYVDPHWWAHWKNELNYREEKPPQGVIVYYGDPDDDFGLNRSMVWKNCKLYQMEHFSISKSGQLLAHVDIDSTLFYYDSTDRLRQSIAYSNSGSDEIENIRLYEYDEFGNILSSAVFFENEEGI